MNKKTMLTTAAVTVLGAGILSASTAFAQQDTQTQHPMDTMVQKIADKFNLNKDEVQAVFDEVYEERHTEMQAHFEKQLTQYVSDGKITDAQKKLILEKRAEMDSQRETSKDNFKNLSNDERKSQMKAKKAELDAWAKENGIDSKYLMPMGGKGPGMGGRGDFGPRDQNQQAPSTSTVTQ